MSKGEIIFIGLGLYDEKDISVKGLEMARLCSKLFVEFYTSRLTGSSLQKLERYIGKPITVLEREEVEKGDVILDAAEHRRVGFLTAGDVFAATTHVDLRLRAERRGVKTRVIHGSSVFTAVPALLGLQHYKFGRTTTLVYPEGSYFPVSPYMVVKENLERGLHTLVLLDINKEAGRYMTISEGVDLLLKMAENSGSTLVGDDTLMCGVARAGSDAPVVKAGSAKTLKTFDFGPPLHTLVVPGDLHFVEEEALRVFAGMR
ncbi:MAG TPA: diphthine synthase [Thermoplasmatales archaeon]|nr:diphthine synthase [Thermoplasmatales archaeon]